MILKASVDKEKNRWKGNRNHSGNRKCFKDLKKNDFNLRENQSWKENILVKLVYFLVSLKTSYLTKIKLTYKI